MKRLALIALLSLGVAGCTTYYKVTDPTTGKTYYTKELKQKKGTSTFKDERTGSSVTIQNSEVAKVSKDEYNAGKYAPETGSGTAAPK